jgi:hypothetical protein
MTLTRPVLRKTADLFAVDEIENDGRRIRALGVAKLRTIREAAADAGMLVLWQTVDHQLHRLAEEAR